MKLVYRRYQVDMANRVPGRLLSCHEPRPADQAKHEDGTQPSRRKKKRPTQSILASGHDFLLRAVMNIQASRPKKLDENSITKALDWAYDGAVNGLGLHEKGERPVSYGPASSTETPDAVLTR